MWRVIAATCLTLAFAPLSVSAEQGDEAVHSFKMSFISKVEMDVKGKSKKENLEAATELYYSWKCRGRERTLTLQSLMVKADVEGVPLMDAFMSRAKMVTKKEGKIEEVLIDKAPKSLRTLLQDAFDTPICKLDVDDSGKEIKRTILAGPGAKSVLDQGMIANALLFHPPFFGDKDEWQADKEISIGSGGYAKGQLTYKKAGGNRFTVGGTLSNDAFSPPGPRPGMRNLRYVVSGQQTYDPVSREWVAGRLSISTFMELIIEGKAGGTASGTMVLSFQKLSK